MPAHRSPLPGRQPESTRECMRECALVAEADRERNVGQRIAWIAQKRKRRIEAKPLQITMRRRAERFVEQLMKPSSAEAAMRGHSTAATPVSLTKRKSASRAPHTPVR